MTLHAQSYLNLALCILLWATIPVASKKILAELSNLQMLFWSTIFSVIALGALVFGQRKVATLARYGPRDFARLSWLGLLGAFLYYILLYGAFARTSAAEGFILAYTWPILITLLAVPLLGERLTPARLLAVVTSFGGVVVIVTRGRLVELSVTSLPGNLLALCGALVFAFFSVQGKRLNYDLTIAAFIYFATALVCAAVAIAFVGISPLPSPPVWGWLLYNGLLVNGISYLFWFMALEHGDTFIVSNLLYLTPALSLLFVRLLLNEPVHSSATLGLLLIAGGILIQSSPKFVGSNTGNGSIS
jgi:drug/metabolite transporter (DMT)-like permease